MNTSRANRRIVVLFLVLPVLAGAGPVAAGQDVPPEPYVQALARLAAGDTADAIAHLRHAARTAPGFGPAFLKLGSLLSARASEVETEFQERLEAQRALERALEIMSDDPEALLEYGLLLWKQRRRVDAKRILDRAWHAAERKAVGLSPSERARLHYALAHIYETWWEDWENLVEVPPTELGTLHCRATQGQPLVGSLAQVYSQFAVYCPREWADKLGQVVPLAELKSEEQQRMLDHFRLVLESGPGHVDAAIRLLGHLAATDEWLEYEWAARKLISASPQDPRGYLFLGLGLHEIGRSVAADTAFRRGLALLSPPERRAFEDITPLLKKPARKRYSALDSAGRVEGSRIFFASTDPLFLTDVEERRLEHYARVAWAELKFAEPATGARGWETERGLIWIRYGRPWKEQQCCFGSALRDRREGTARYLIWSYGPEGPNFVFSKRLTYRYARLTDPSKLLADDLAGRAPEFYRPHTVTAVYRIPHQGVRFRGSEPGLTRLEIYGVLPMDSLGVSSGGALEAGLIIHDDGYRAVWNRRDTSEFRGTPIGLTYALELPAGQYRYALEGRAVGLDLVPRPLGRTRVVVALHDFPSGRLALSDLLLADAIRALSPDPTSREHLRIWPSRTLRFAPGAPVHIYFEVYGLQPDADGLARYRVEMAVEDAAGRNLIERIARGVVELFRARAQVPVTRWERVAAVDGDMVVEYLRVDLPKLGTGRYTIRLGVMDLATGERAETTRAFEIGE